MQQLVLVAGDAASAPAPPAVQHVAAASGADFIEPGPMLPPAVEICRTAMVAVSEDMCGEEAGMGVQLVLQSTMSLLLTLLSTGQGKPGAAVPVLSAVVRLQGALIQREVRAAAACPAAAAADSQAVAAGWFVLGRCLLQLSEQLQLCAGELPTVRLAPYLLTGSRQLVHEYNCIRGAPAYRTKSLLGCYGVFAEHCTVLGWYP
jgi:hypothetical protein